MKRIKVVFFILILVFMAVPLNCVAGEKDELLGQKKYIEQKLTNAQAEFEGFVKASQIQIQTFQNDLRGITQRLSQIEEEAKKNPPKAGEKK